MYALITYDVLGSAGVIRRFGSRMLADLETAQALLSGKWFSLYSPDGIVIYTNY